MAEAGAAEATAMPAAATGAEAMSARREMDVRGYRWRTWRSLRW